MLTYEDDVKGEWHMLMPDSVRDSLSDLVPQFMNYINAGQLIPSVKEIRMRMALHRFSDSKNNVLLLTHMDGKHSIVYLLYRPVC